MTRQELFEKLKSSFRDILEQHQLSTEEIHISAKGQTPQEAIGNTARKDYPILTGKEIMLIADFKGSKGQAFTDAPARFSGTLQDILEMDLEESAHARGLFIASLNAVMSHLKLSDNVIHCKDDGPEFCSRCMVDWVEARFGSPKIALIGFQPALIGSLSQHFSLQVLDLDPNNIGKIKDGCPIRDGAKEQKEVLNWADLVLCTGSTLCNGTIVDFMELSKPVVFFGTTLSGAAPILGLQRACFSDEAYARSKGI